MTSKQTEGWKDGSRTFQFQLKSLIRFCGLCDEWMDSDARALHDALTSFKCTSTYDRRSRATRHFVSPSASRLQWLIESATCVTALFNRQTMKIRQLIVAPASSVQGVFRRFSGSWWNEPCDVIEGELDAGVGEVDVVREANVVTRTDIALSCKRRYCHCTLVKHRNVVRDSAITIPLKNTNN